MGELYLVRHGETDSNLKNKFLGHTDIKINENGILQAVKLSKYFKDIKITKFYSSPLIRAKMTSEILNKNLNLNILYSDQLKERNFGIFDNLSYDEIKNKYEKEYNLWLSDLNYHKIENGESAFDVYKRCEDFLKSLSFENEKILIVTHLGIIRNILSILFKNGLDGIWHYKAQNCSVTKIDFVDNYPVLDIYNKVI